MSKKKYLGALFCICILVPLQGMQWLVNIETKVTNFLYQDDRAIGTALKNNDFEAIDKYIKKWGMQNLNMPRKMYGKFKSYGGTYCSQPILIRALSQHHPDMIQHLIDHNADVNCKTDNVMSALRATLEYLAHASTDTIRNDYITILHKLVQHGASLCEECDDETDFFYAGCKIDKPYNLKAIKILMEGGARPNQDDLLKIIFQSCQKNDPMMFVYAVVLSHHYQSNGSGDDIIFDNIRLFNQSKLDPRYSDFIQKICKQWSNRINISPDDFSQDSIPDIFYLAALDEDIYTLRSFFEWWYNQIDLSYYFERMYHLKKIASCRELIFLSHLPAPQTQERLSKSEKILKKMRTDTATASAFMQVNLMRMNDLKKLCDTHMHFV